MKNILLILLLSSFCLVQAQDSLLIHYAKGIQTEEMKEHVRTLASTDFEGRGTGQAGLDKAAEYLKQQFSTMNLNGPSPTGDPYFQEFKLITSNSQSIEIISQNDTLNTDQSLALIGSMPNLDGVVEIVFAGYGIDHPNYSDLKDLDVKGKIVAFMDGEPRDKNGRYLVSGSFLPFFVDRGMTKTKALVGRGALAAIRINPNQEQVLKAVKMLARFKAGAQYSLATEKDDLSAMHGVLQIGIDDANRLFQLKGGSLQKALEKMEKGKNRAGAFSSRATIKSNQSGDSVLTKNVVAFLPGSELPDEVLIITAHFDHLGMRDDAIYFGADDNATGTAAVLEVAEAFAEMAAAGVRPKRSILFMPVTGEERGLLGSKYYVSHPLFPLEKTVATINMDMIGRSDEAHAGNPNYVYVYLNDTTGSRMDQFAQKASEIVQGQLAPEFRYKSDNDFRMGGSDHASFEPAGIPVMYFFCGTHPDYHRPSDTWEKIEFEKLTAVTRMVFSSAWQLANQ